jgi:pimeloyl-ACP methyl ester carboxylesterase
MRRAVSLLVLALACACAAPEPPPAADPGGPTIGVVVLHGKWGTPYGQTLRFTRAMQREGFLTDSPEMPWSGQRSYDAGVAGMVAEIDAAVERLKSRGAEKVFVAGHSMGAAGAVRYARVRRVDGLIALAPGHIPEGPRFAKAVAGSLQKAKAMPAGESGWFDDPNTGNRKVAMHMKAGVYVEYFDPAGPMNFHDNIAALRPGTPVLWVVGDTEDPLLKKADQGAFAALPRNPPPKFVEVAAGHLDTPDAAVAVCAAWMREVAKR